MANDRRALARIPAKPYQYGTLAGTLNAGGNIIQLGNDRQPYTYAISNRIELEQIVSRRQAQVALSEDIR